RRKCCSRRGFPDDDPHVADLLRDLTERDYPATPRKTVTTRTNQVFSSEQGRQVLEQAFLRAGARIKYDLCPRLSEHQWPLGYDALCSPGFGSLLVTHRNCPNNCPLALWAGSPWFPLFPRRINVRR